MIPVPDADLGPAAAVPPGTPALPLRPAAGPPGEPGRDPAFVLRVLRAFAEWGDGDAVVEGAPHGLLWWRVDGEYAPVTFLVTLSDVFRWASADAERIMLAVRKRWQD